MARFGENGNHFDLPDDGPPPDTTDGILALALGVLRDHPDVADSGDRLLRMARWVVRNLGVPDRESFPGVMVDHADDTVSLSEDHLEWLTVEDARLLAASVLRAVDRAEGG